MRPDAPIKVYEALSSSVKALHADLRRHIKAYEAIFRLCQYFRLFDARGLTYFDRGALHEAILEFGAAIKYLPQVLASF